MTTPSSEKGRADQRADTPRTEYLGGRRHANEPDTPVLRVLACTKCGERHTVDVTAILAEAAAEPAAAEPLDPLGVEIRDWRAAQPPTEPPDHHCCSGCDADGHCTHGLPAAWYSGYDRGVRNTVEVERALKAAGSSRGVTPALHTTGTDESAEPQRYVGVTPALDVERLERAQEAAWEEWERRYPGLGMSMPDGPDYRQFVAAEYARLGSPEDSDATSR